MIYIQDQEQLRRSGHNTDLTTIRLLVRSSEIYKVSRLYEMDARYYENASRLYEMVSRYYEKVSGLYEKGSRYYENVSRYYEKVFVFQSKALVRSSAPPGITV